jgi:hypothetical protein
MGKDSPVTNLSEKATGRSADVFLPKVYKDVWRIE